MNIIGIDLSTSTWGADFTYGIAPEVPHSQDVLEHQFTGFLFMLS